MKLLGDMKKILPLIFLLAMALAPSLASGSGQFWLDTAGEQFSYGSVSPGLSLHGRAPTPVFVGPYRISAPDVAEIDSLSSYFLGKASEYYYRGIYDQALIYTDKALEANPTLALAWCNKANALLCLGRSADALFCYDRAISICPNDLWAWVGKGRALSALGKSSESEAAFIKAKELGYSS
jgi:tetratricopeptide (TPR) repeat protein